MIPNRFSEQQNKAINAIDGQILLIACPGSGKTTTIVNRAKNMVDSGIDPATMLNITFTKSAADVMAKRFRDISDARVEFSTIHAFCYRLLSKHCGYDQNDILKNSDQYVFIATRLRELGVPGNEIEDQTKEAIAGINRVRNMEMSVMSYDPDKLIKEDFIDVYEKYQEYKTRIRKIDFDDMIIDFRDRLKNNVGFLEHCRKKYKYITVDEFQDVNRIQADIFYDIAGEDGNIFVVGDDDQGIYGFRGADSGIMLDFPKHYPNCTKLSIDTNYRSKGNIIGHASKLINHNRTRFSKDFKADRENDGRISIFINNNVTRQARKVCEEIKNNKTSGQDYENMAVLYRTNNEAVAVSAVLAKENIPFYTTEHVASIHESPVFGDIKAYYRLAGDIPQKGDFQRILNRPSRYAKAERYKDCDFDKAQVLKIAKDDKPYVLTNLYGLFHDVKNLSAKKVPSDFVDYISVNMGYREWLGKHAEYMHKKPDEFYAVLSELKEEASEFDAMEDWFRFAEYYDRKLRDAAKAANREGVCLSTFHGAKGLEWESVFIINANDGYCPYKKAMTENELEEERRMFYVAMTRAKDNLSILLTDGEGDTPSPYLAEAGFNVKITSKPKPEPRKIVDEESHVSDLWRRMEERQRQENKAGNTKPKKPFKKRTLI